jgi:hypothetical protein
VRETNIAAGLSPPCPEAGSAESTTLSSETPLRTWQKVRISEIRQQDLQAINMRLSSAGENTLAKLVDRSQFANNLAGRTIAGHTARLLREWLKPSSHVDHTGSSCLAITLTGEEIVEIVHKKPSARLRKP